jgi:hypothetical protein
MSVLPHIRQLKSAEARQWKISGSTILDVEYQGRMARVEALISPSLEDEIFLGWTNLRDLMSGPIYGNQSPTPSAKAKRHHDMKPESLHNHSKTTWAVFTPRRKNDYRTPTKSCPGCEATG